MRKISNFIFLFLSLLGCAQFKGNGSPYEAPLVIGHRGASGYRPEHTRMSYQLAIQQGADYIEPDLVPTKDGILIARHENELSGTTDVATRFPKRKTKKMVDGKEVLGWFSEDFTVAEIKGLRARERLSSRVQSFNGTEPILTFQEVIEIAQQAPRPVGLYPELKHPTYFRQLGLPVEKILVEALQKAHLNRSEARVIVQSAELSSLQKVRESSPVKLQWLIDDLSARPFDHVVAGDPRTYGDMIRLKSLSELSSLLYAIGPYKRLIVPEDAKNKLGPATTLVADAHSAGLKVHAYTFRSDPSFLAGPYGGDAAQEYRQFYELGVDGVFSDFPDQAVRARP